MLSPINIISTSKHVQGIPMIEVSACPISNDVIGLQDLYLQLDISNSTIDMVSDTIDSGNNSSGTLYVGTSSYKGSDIARLKTSSATTTNLRSADTYTLGSSSTY